MMEGEVQIGGKVMLQSNAALNGQVRFIEIRVRLEIELPPW
jgi:carbonic anhydrase/acetyltransferase-like protein (isoleucine patch superfamily)